MKVLSIIDSFKGTITSNDLGKIMTEELSKKGIEAAYIPISDGGDGFLDAIEKVTKIERIYVNCIDPLRRDIETYYLLDKLENQCYIELAKASGINLLTKEELNPFITSTYGLGQLIVHAINSGIKKIIVGIGGSATNDGGAGMLEAMGCLFYDQFSKKLTNLSGGMLDKIYSIDTYDFNKMIEGIEFVVLSDVTNPLLSLKGATFVFSKQKGAKDEDLPVLERKMKHYAGIVEENLMGSHSLAMGAGAAGGVGFALIAFFKAKFHKGIDYILNLVNFDTLIKDYDYIITGEGKIDKQSLDGKVVFGISQRAKNKKIILVCAINEINANDLINKNIYKIYSIVDKIATIEASLNNPYESYRKLCASIEL